MSMFTTFVVFWLATLAALRRIAVSAERLVYLLDCIYTAVSHIREYIRVEINKGNKESGDSDE
jgi:hypothetical protein